ncbi:MAG: NAD-dependent epimerase [Desulfovibrio sp.]|nr:NAD-dependent epimerase [Desulfovibrio sp.]
MHILVTGAAGFIGYHVSERLARQGHTIVGIDNFNEYYSPRLKQDRIRQLAIFPQFRSYSLDLADMAGLNSLFASERFTHVIHLAAQAGVRYSLVNPQSYIQSNIVGFANLLEACRCHKIQHLVYASSSSVYGLSPQLPFSVDHPTDHPVSLYAATKKSNELMAHTYSHLYGLPTTGLRFFTVYGPWGRPDMALFLFTKAMLEGRSIPVFNNGDMRRDFTYIDDIVDALVSIIVQPAESSPEWAPQHPLPSISHAPYVLYNIGNNNAVQLKDFIAILENALGCKAKLELLPMQPGDVQATFADILPLQAKIGFIPQTSLETGIKHFVLWYKQYFKEPLRNR